MVPSVDLNRYGSYEKSLTAEEVAENKEKENELEASIMEDFLDDFTIGEDDDSRVNAASHGVTIRYSYSDEQIELRSAAEINNLLGGHALTVHKFQGSECKRVFIVLHKSHAIMVQRELLYTAVTRARNILHIICENESFFNGVKSQKVKGTTLEEKIETFKGKGKFEEMQLEMTMLKGLQVARERKLARENEENKARVKKLLAPELINHPDIKSIRIAGRLSGQIVKEEPDPIEIFENEGGLVNGGINHNSNFAGNISISNRLQNGKNEQVNPTLAERLAKLKEMKHSIRKA
jgi:hypothetical protein